MRRSRTALGAFAILLAFTVARAAPLERDLGQGLVYFRVHHLPADLPADEARQNRACVLDLRYATGDAAAAEVLGGWLKFHAKPKSLLLVLVNGATDPRLQAAVARQSRGPGMLTIGIAGQPLMADITVSDTAANELQAYQALEKGATVATLTTDHPDKQRNDEASLAHEPRPESPELEITPAGEKVVGKHPAPLIDAALQRAIHLHRALRAMKKV